MKAHYLQQIYPTNVFNFNIYVHKFATQPPSIGIHDPETMVERSLSRNRTTDTTSATSKT